MEKLHIITRCTRIENLILIKDTIINNAKTFDKTWHVIFDTNIIKDVDVEILGKLYDDSYKLDLRFLASSKGAYGYDSINKIVDTIPNIDPSFNEWFYLLDDDNVLHEDFHKLADHIKKCKNKELGVVVFNQFIGGKDFTGLQVRVAAPENTRIGGIDAAQYMVKRKMLSWPSGIAYNLDYCADGMLMNFLLTVFEDSFLFINEIFCYYNYIESNKKAFSLPKILLIGQDEPVKLESAQWVDY
ncbi:MAG: hypothetical protein WC343_12760, partial [Bacilli bacterium]